MHCQCTRAALRCHAEARQLTLKQLNSILSFFLFYQRNETKQEIWLPDIGTFGSFVSKRQRVSKNIMAVKY